MENLSINEMLEMQKNLQEKYRDKWKPLSPELGINQTLWLMVELGEVADILKKKGTDKVMSEKETRCLFIEEMCDVLMFYNDLLLCYNITSEEITKIYKEKHNKNLSRW